MRERVIEGFGGLAGQGTAGFVGNGTGDHNREINTIFIKHLFDGKYSSFGIEGVEDGFNQNNIRATLDQTTSRLHVRDYQLIKSDIAKTRVINIRGNTTSATSRA